MVSGDKCCMRDCRREEHKSRPNTKLKNKLPELCDATLGACLLFVRLTHNKACVPIKRMDLFQRQLTGVQRLALPELREYIFILSLLLFYFFVVPK